MISPDGLRTLKRLEGLVLETYRDAVGVLTIGYGHTGSEAFEGNRITKARAEELLMQDIKPAEEAIQNYVTVPLTKEQHSALVLFIFNVGVGAFKRSTLLKKLNQSDYLGAADEFLRWNKAGGKVLKGLSIRRNDERQMFLKGTGQVETEHKLESNIVADPVEPRRTLSEPGVQGTATLAAAGALSELTTQLEPLAAYSDMVRMIWVGLSLVAIVFVIYKSKKDQ